MTHNFSVGVASEGIPFVGHVLQLVRDPWGFLASLPSQGDLVQIKFRPWHAFVLCDPELTRRVLIDDRTFDKGGPFYDRTREIIGVGLVTCPHDQHRQLRRQLRPAFQPQCLPGYAAAMAGQIAEITGSWREGHTIDVLTEMHAIMTGIMAKTIFTAELSPQALSETHKDILALVEGIYTRTLVPRSLSGIPTPGRRRFIRTRENLRGLAGRAIQDYRRDGADRGDVLSILLAARDEHGQGLSDGEIIEQLLNSFLAGIDTTAATLCWALHALAADPDLEARLRQETDTVLGGRPATWDDLPQLHLTKRILTEALRLWPPVWLASRFTTTDTDIGGHPVPASTHLYYSPYLIHRRADLYPHPDRFDPDRWLTQDHASSPGAFVPFGLGARKCIGETFAMTAATLALASITARWQLTPAFGALVRPALAAVMAPRPAPMRLTARPLPPALTPDNIPKSNPRQQPA